MGRTADTLVLGSAGCSLLVAAAAFGAILLCGSVGIALAPPAREAPSKVAPASSPESEPVVEKHPCGRPYLAPDLALARRIRRIAHDPDSVAVSDCTIPVLTEDRCWVSTCTVRAANAFGAIRASRWELWSAKGRVVDYGEAGGR